MRNTRAMLAACVAASVWMAFPAVSADGSATPPPATADGREDDLTLDPCAVDPGDVMGEAHDGAEDSATGQSLAETLDECDGVLQPPSVGDADLVEPAPDAGRTPVIPPSELPLGDTRDVDE
jgi:hypothetical protein